MARIGLVLGAGGAVGHAYPRGSAGRPRRGDRLGRTRRGGDRRHLGRIGRRRAVCAPASRVPISRLARPTARCRRKADASRHAPTPPATTCRRSRRRPQRRPLRGAVGAGRVGARRAATLERTSGRARGRGRLPEGRVPTELVASGLRPLFTGWPSRPLWIVAVDLERGRRVTFGRDGAPTITDVATAVAASCAIPAFFAPVSIGGVRYVDGGVHSPTNADLVAELGLDLVVISSPMSIARTNPRFAPDQPARRLARFRLAREVARIRRTGTPVLTFQPTDADLQVMGLNAMDAVSPRRRHAPGARIDPAPARAARRTRARVDPRVVGYPASLSSSVIPASTPAHNTAISGAVS